ncbi:RNA polymerase sigma factor [Streptomyces sp. NPDC056039]|uniref:RNA polymerase sigma factor n=1 Tax=Streptomyces sp. NPDC056039 TaxID=3345687 RepID=UPI0035D71900
MANTRTPTTGEPLLQPSDIELVRAMLALGGVPWGELEDGVQQVRVKLLETKGRIRNLQAWLSVVASRVAVDWHRSRTRDESLREKLAARWQGLQPAGESEDSRLLALTVAEGLEGLPMAQRQVLALRYYTDLSVRDIAHHLSVPEGTVKSRLHNAVAALGRRLRDMEVI